MGKSWNIKFSKENPKT
ncbi:hypothetical protein LINPERHAP1_LOCUS39998 [Linum perenne]